MLFAGSERLTAAVAEAVLAAAEADFPLSRVLGALSEVGTQLVQYVDHAAALRAVIDTSVELQERSAPNSSRSRPRSAKHARSATLSTESLRDRTATDGDPGHPG